MMKSGLHNQHTNRKPQPPKIDIQPQLEIQLQTSA